jgi:hypothetical protein
MTPRRASTASTAPTDDLVVDVEVDAPPADLDEALAAAVDTGPPRGSRLRLPTWLRGSSPAPTFFGIAVAIAGFVLILVAWGQVAGETQVSLQLPYLVSAGLTGLGLVMVGLTIVSVAAEQREAAARDRQMDQLVSILEELKTALGEKGRKR